MFTISDARLITSPASAIASSMSIIFSAFELIESRETDREKKVFQIARSVPIWPCRFFTTSNCRAMAPFKMDNSGHRSTLEPRTNRRSAAERLEVDRFQRRGQVV